MARQRIYLNPRGANTLIYDTNSSDNYLKDIVVKRAAGQISSLSFTVENGGTLPEPMDEINVKVADGGDKEVFWGRVISIQKNMYNEYEVVCEGISARLNDVYLAEIKFRKKHTWTENGTPKVNTDGISTNNQTTWICGATVGRQIELLSSMVNAQLTELPISMWASGSVDSKPGVHLDFENADALTILSTIASAVGGSLYLENAALVVPSDYNAGTLTQQIAYGSNLVDFKDLFNFAPIATAVIPFGAYWNDSSYGAAGTVGDDWHRIGLEDLYGKSGYSDVKRIAIPRTYDNMGQQKYYYYIQDDTKVAQYGKIFTSQIWDNIGTYGDLYTQAKAYLNSVNATQTITINAIDLTGSAKFEPYYIVKFVNGQGSEISLRIVSQEIHIGEPEKDTVTLGDTATTITRGAGSAVTNAMMQEITNTVRANVIEQNNVQITNEFKQEIAQIKQMEIISVDALPTASADTMNKIYLVPAEESKESNVKDEYITLKNGEMYSWEKIGSTDVDLSPYAKSVSLNGESYEAENGIISLPNYPTTLPASDVKEWAKADTKPSYEYSEIQNKPDTFTPSAHSHTKSDITDFPSNVSAFTNDAGYITSYTEKKVICTQAEYDSMTKASNTTYYITD